MATKSKKREIYITKDEALALVEFVKATKKNSRGYYINWDQSSGLGTNLGIKNESDDGSPAVIKDITDYDCW